MTTSKRPAVLVVDLLEDFFIQPPLSELRAELVAATQELTTWARSQGHPVIWVRQEFEPDLSDAFLSMRRTGRRVTIRGTLGCRLLSELELQPGDHEVIKRRYSAFLGTGLAELLAELRVTHLILGGVNTHACIRTTAVDAYQQDWPVILATDLIRSYDAEFHRESLRYLIQSIGEPMDNATIAQHFGRH